MMVLAVFAMRQGQKGCLDFCALGILCCELFIPWVFLPSDKLIANTPILQSCRFGTCLRFHLIHVTLS